MTKSEEITRKILKDADLAYENGELTLSNPEYETGVSGDGLADFIHVEIAEVTTGIEDEDMARSEARHAMANAIAQLERVLEAI